MIPCQTSEVKEIHPRTRTWIFEKWRSNHVFLAATCSHFMEVAGVKLRFFLRPREETLLLPNRRLLNEYYSLWIELLSNHEERVLLKIYCRISVGRRNTFYTDRSGREAQILFEGRKGNLSREPLIQEVDKEFIRVAGFHWMCNSDVNGFDKKLTPNLGKRYTHDAEYITIDVEVAPAILATTVD